MGLAAAFITKNKDENSKAMNRKGGLFPNQRTRK